jgi:3-oxoacyl-[acyl-carrier protein] reductase
MDLGLRGKNVIITGGTHGIGWSIAEEFADEYCNIGICARNADAVQCSTDRLMKKGVIAIGKAVDVRDSEGLKVWIDSVAQDLGGIDVLVCNASGFDGQPGNASWKNNFEIDIMGTVTAVESCVPYLEKSNNASIVIISSNGAVENFNDVFGQTSGAYTAMKAALINFAASLGKSLISKGIRTNTVSPGATYFDGGGWQIREMVNPEIFKKMLARCPMNRFARPDEIAKAVVFLASPAASYIAGTNLIVDGGQSNRIQY